ncbi:MAG: 30S ribosomal protein S7 [Dehalococcoidia bacterium]|nr:30S ribosomal protein S7 [Dehalococcoidia bacterium]
MPRRAFVHQRKVEADPKYNSELVAVFVRKIMLGGKKSTAQSVFYDAMDLIQEKESKEPLAVLQQAVTNATPLLEVRPRRVGGANYQVPVEVRKGRDQALALRWLIKASRDRSGKSMAEKLSSELIDASKGLGSAVKRREETHKMAEANRAFAHYKW